jgi:hypothetical protein
MNDENKNTMNIPVADVSPTTAFNLTPQIDTTVPSVAGDMAFFKQLQTQQSDEQKRLESQQGSSTSNINTILGSLAGLGTEQSTMEQTTVNPLQSQLTDITGQIGTRLAEYQQAEKQYEKLKTDLEVGVRGAGNADIRASMLYGQQGAVDRAKAAELNVKASDIALLQAQALATQGKVDLAQKQIDRAIDLKYKSQMANLETQRFQLEQIEKGLNREEKKQWEAQQYALKREETRIAEQKQNEKDIQGLGLKLSEFGVDQGTISSVLGAKTFNEAIKLAGSKLQDPRVRFEIEKMRLDNQLTREKIATEARQRELMGVLTPKEKQAELEAMKTQEGALGVINDKVTLIDGIMSSPAMDSVVGTSFLTRAPSTFLGTAGRIVSLAGIPSVIGGAKDTITGERQNFIGSVEQLVDQEFLDKLISVKAKGATFGALTDRSTTKLCNQDKQMENTRQK